ncbi:uroporphyrinogen-III C-methyltransferase [Candidatus Nitrospira nitrificans]|uniref:uroporphyrinogen-III C-methyltransferase n=1 Tax=Candidatus Nitrospira nitrificans TaxID=1742973 RepID=A0A0S4LDK9_9BACT|nr:uroporphyrinogen-III C-methyltransferase [Candidatus Nitrospira nitrificans]CUS34696.1 Porphyrin biosynthesis protein HemD [Candidatus Nitrospira nitrificans]
MVRRNKGKVYLVGAGPGDPGLLTLRGKECLEQADVVLYDYLANPTLLAHARDHAARVYVGRRGKGTYPEQEAINRLLIEQASAGNVVVRLKGGDPFVFGRGGEEAEALASAGIKFEIIPGVTAAVAAPAYAGIPVTHRTMASTLTIVTGHEDPEKPSTTLDWSRLASSQGTVVFLMGMKNLSTIAATLMAEGRAGSTPVAIIRWGTRVSQRTIIGTLADIVEKAESAHMEPPAVIVVGEVVRLRSKLNWFEQRPLFGKRVLMTRAKEQAGELAARLAGYGADPVEAPTIKIVPPPDWAPVDRALSEIRTYEWIIFTSVNGVSRFMTRLFARGFDARCLAGRQLCCIGPRTAQELEKFGVRADLVPEEYQAEGVLVALNRQELQGTRILIPRAETARELLPDELRAAGAHVDVIPVYRTLTPDEDVGGWRQELMDHRIHVVTFTSSSTVRNFVTMLGGAEAMKPLVQSVAIACIGPITAKTAEEYGLAVSIMPDENTIPALVDAIAHHYESREQVVTGAPQ